MIVIDKVIIIKTGKVRGYMAGKGFRYLGIPYGEAYVTGGIGKGGAMGMTYDMQTFANDTNCIVVTVNYRLGVLGFMDFSWIDKRFERNLGLKDLILALQWIQENIDAFDGDAACVTLFGQSAGAALIAALYNIPTANKLFHRTIMESGCLESFYTPIQARRLAEKYISLLGLHSKNLADKLFEMPTEVLVSRMDELDLWVQSERIGICSINPVVDGEFLQAFPTLEILSSGKPAIIGNNRDEALLFTHVMKDTRGDICNRALPFYTEHQQNQILSHYPEFPSKQANGLLLTDAMYTYPK